MRSDAATYYNDRDQGHPDSPPTSATAAHTRQLVSTSNPSNGDDSTSGDHNVNCHSGSRSSGDDSRIVRIMTSIDGGLGVTLQKASDKEFDDGRRIARLVVKGFSIMPYGRVNPAVKAGVRVGDIIEGVNGKTGRSSRYLVRLLKDAQGGEIFITLSRPAEEELESAQAVRPNSTHDTPIHVDDIIVSAERRASLRLQQPVETEPAVSDAASALSAATTATDMNIGLDTEWPMYEYVDRVLAQDPHVGSLLPLNAEPRVTFQKTADGLIFCKVRIASRGWLERIFIRLINHFNFNKSFFYLFDLFDFILPTSAFCSFSSLSYLDSILTYLIVACDSDIVNIDIGPLCHRRHCNLQEGEDERVPTSRER